MKPSMTQEQWDTSIAGWPEPVRSVASKYPATRCYRSTDNPAWHFVISGYDVHNETAEVFVELVHGRDSTLPGVKTFGQNPGQLIACACGKWEPPTQEQIEERRRHIEAVRAANGLPPLSET